MNKIRRKKCQRATAISRANQKQFPFQQGITIWECECNCPDCEYGHETGDYGTHDPFHFPHYRYEFMFNTPEDRGAKVLLEDGDYRTVSVSEVWKPKQIQRGLDGLFPLGLSWTQYAIARCNELDRA